MLRGALSRVVVSGARILSQQPASYQALTYPVDEPKVHAAGPNPDRLLFVGSGAIAGLGVASHRSSVVGHASRAIATLTGRGVDAEVYPDTELTIRSALAVLEGVRLSRFDAIVISVGLNDLFIRTSPAAWGAALTALLDALEAGIPASCCVFLIGIANPVESQLFRRSMVRSASARAEALNRVSRKLIASRPFATYVDFTAGAPEKKTGTYATNSHARWAAQIAGPIAQSLDRDFVAGTRRGNWVEEAEDDRQAAVENLGMLDTPAEERFDRIVRMASVLLKTQSAALALIDNERVWFKSSVGVDVPEIDRIASLCTTTITERGGLEVPDASRDERFAGSPLVTGEPKVRFYVGYPVESVEGLPVGALCVFDPTPREPEPTSLTVLRDLALLIQGELAR